MMLEHVTHRRARTHRLHDQVIRKIALRILRGEPLAANVGFPSEADLCREFKVSRSILREAVKVLEAKGMVELRPKVGITVLPRQEWNVVDPAVLEWQSEILPDTTFLRDLLEFRRAVEPIAAELAARRARPEEIELLFTWLDNMEARVANRPEFIAADMRFHAAIFAGCHNCMLQRINLTVHGALLTSRMISTGVQGTSARSLRQHREVARAIRAHDPATARFAMDALISIAALDVEAALQDKPETGFVETADADRLTGTTRENLGLETP